MARRRTHQGIAQVASECGSRYNDVIADPRGRVFCGAMSTEQGKGSLYRLDLDGSINRLLPDIGCSNGMAFTPDSFGSIHSYYLWQHNSHVMGSASGMYPAQS